MRTAVVTGAASGIGLALTRRLLEQKTDVAAVVRQAMPRMPELERAIDEGRLRIYRGDLADAASRRSLVEAIAAAEPRVDALFNNAGVSTGKLEFSPQGRELHFEVNCLAPYVLAEGLRASLSAVSGRIVNTASDALFFDKRYDPESLAAPARFRTITGPYATSKLALCLWSSAASAGLSCDGITIVSIAPGAFNTPLIRGPGMPTLMKPLAWLIARPPSEAAELLIDAATADHPTASLVVKRSVRPLPFLDHADRTLEIVAAAAAH
ncbi:MAG TPA: SDR family NAD(P)-dependent oxidoreductase [Sphingorhabdus sp.]|nr:SDR family NAD(P)-dependent oxidoreductase [Sphingorhabdus sp.]